ncbi:MAG: pantetheine-phosphate adenylyltransferase [Cryomorphaceae bacterium]
MKTAVFPGSFDPFTNGHEDIVRKAFPLFDKVIVAIGVNSSKQYLFDLKQRKKWIEHLFRDDARVEVVSFEGLTIDLCKKHQAGFILRGLRNQNDFQYESNIAHMNEGIDPSIQSVFLLCDPRFAAINASIVREIFKNGGDVSNFIPDAIDLHA